MNNSTLKQMWLVVKENYQLAIITFEIFWIVVFLIDRIHGGEGGGVPRFVYVNF